MATFREKYNHHYSLQIVHWGILSFKNKDPEVVNKNRMDVQMDDILLLTFLSQEKMQSDEEEEGNFVIIKSSKKEGG